MRKATSIQSLPVRCRLESRRAPELPSAKASLTTSHCAILPLSWDMTPLMWSIIAWRRELPLRFCIQLGCWECQARV
ncbi:hypothetical protein SALBM217S_05708 [Streptomyces griseoloalbus]